MLVLVLVYAKPSLETPVGTPDCARTTRLATGIFKATSSAPSLDFAIAPDNAIGMGTMVFEGVTVLARERLLTENALEGEVVR